MNHAGTWKRGETIRVRLALIKGAMNDVDSIRVVFRRFNEPHAENEPCDVQSDVDGWFVTITDERSLVLDLGRYVIEGELTVNGDVYITDSMTFDLAKSVING